MTKITLDRAVAEQALEALEKDAQRYRKLRNASMDERNRLEHYAGPELDKMLDALQRLTDVQQEIEAALAEPEPPIGKASTDVGVPVYVVKKAAPQNPCNKSCAPGYCYCESVQEPVCWYDPTDFTRTTNRQTEKEYAPLYTSPPQRPAEPVQEPDYWQEEARRYAGNADYWRKRYEALAKPVQEPFGYLWPTGRHPEFRFTQQKRDGVDGTPVYTAPPQRKPLSEKEIIDLWVDIARALRPRTGSRREHD